MSMKWISWTAACFALLVSRAAIAAVDTNKYHGGSYDGHDLAVGEYQKLDGTAFVITLAKYHGGSYDGYAIGTSALDIPIPITLCSFIAQSEDGEVILHWVTGSETENLGYHVYRSLMEHGEYERITEALIEGAGSSRTTRMYRFIDRDVQEEVTYFYQIEDVSFSGNIQMHGPVSVVVTKAKPTAFALLQNHPNPFNPTTAIAYDVPEGSDLALIIYTLTGQKVATLVSGHREAGHYEVVWDGSGWANGVYFYRLEAGSFVETKRMVLLK